MRALHTLEQPVGGDLPGSADATLPRTTRCASSRLPASCRSPVTPRWAHATPGCAPVVCLAIEGASCSSARPGSSPSVRSMACWRSRLRPSPAPVRWQCLTWCASPASSASTWPISSTASGSTTAPAGWRSCWPRRTRCWRCSRQAAPSTSISASWACTRPAAECAYEVRAIFSNDRGDILEDPVTGSLNASLAQWLIGSGRVVAALHGQPGDVPGAHRPAAHQHRRGRRGVGRRRHPHAHRGCRRRVVAAPSW